MAFTRREIGLGALAVAAVGATAIGFRLFGGRGTAVAGTFEVTHTPEEWRKLLSPQQYAVLREQDTERALARAHASAQQVDTGNRGGGALGEDIVEATVAADVAAGDEVAAKVEAAVVEPSVEAATTEAQAGGTEEGA